MCGILTILEVPGCSTAPTPAEDDPRANHLLDRLAHRGPDGRGVFRASGAWLGQRRLAIVDPRGGAQPFVCNPARVACVSNSEIYNHHALRPHLDDSIARDLPLCDGAVKGPLWKRLGLDAVARLDGQFAFVAVDLEQPGQWIAARDHMGICPLYMGRDSFGRLWFASELKCLVDDCVHVEIVPPGHAWVCDETGVHRVKWYEPAWAQTEALPDTPADLTTLRETLIDAVVERLMCDMPCGLLLSGGLDSSLIASIAVRCAEQSPTFHRLSNRFHTFSIGLPGSPDVQAAREMADFLGTTHHEFTFTVEEALAAVPHVVKHQESFEQIRTGVPTYLLAQRIRELGIKMVLSGEGADELFGGYLYFHRAPSAQAMHEELVRKVTRLHQFDVMRANKSPMAHGLEVRVPFLDKSFVDLAMSIDPREKMINMREMPDGVHPRLEKYMLRKAFDDPADPWLPDSILWRQKEQFSDGVGYDWVDALRDFAAKRLSPGQWEGRFARFDALCEGDAPATPEMYWMRELFETLFVEGREAGASALDTVPRGRSIACSTPEAISWDPEWETSSGDISGRAIRGVHASKADFTLDDRAAASAHRAAG